MLVIMRTCVVQCSEVLVCGTAIPSPLNTFHVYPFSLLPLYTCGSWLFQLPLDFCKGNVGNNNGAQWMGLPYSTQLNRPLGCYQVSLYRQDRRQ